MSIYLSTTLTIHLLTIAYALISSAAEKSIDINAFEAMMARSYGDLSSVQSNSKISMGTETFAHRSLELSEGQCWSTRDDRKPNRYCIFDDTPREGAFLSLSCPTSRDDLTQCGCTIGIGDSEDAPNTGTCWKCGFCRDGSLAYDCRNVAEGTCIGRNCLDDCISSYTEPQDLLLDSGGMRLGLSVVVPLTSLALVYFHL